MPVFTKSPATQLAKRLEDRAKLEGRIQELNRELGTLRNVSDDAILDAVLSADGARERDKSRKRVRELEDELQDLHTAMRAQDGRIRAARRSVAHERAEVVRAEAAKLQAELDAHNAKTAELKKALEDHDGQPYYPTPGWALQFGQRIEDLNLPPATRMQMRIGELLAQADRIENAEPEEMESPNVVTIAPRALVAPERAPEVRTVEPTPLMAPRRGWYEAS